MPLYELEIDSIDQNDWDNLITQFDDATIYQCWAFAAHASRDDPNISHIILKQAKEIIGCCQIKLKRLPFLPIGIADVKWGPIYFKKQRNLNSAALKYLIRGIKEYSIKHGYMIRIEPHIKGEEKEFLRETLEQEGFRRNTARRPYRTFMVDLSLPIEDIRKNFLQKWRNCLNKAEKCNLSISVGTSIEDYDIFVNLSKEMVTRKNLIKEHFKTLENYRCIQNALPDHLKMQIMICKADGVPVSATIFSAIGDTGIYLLGASGDNGLKFNASYLLQWNMIKWLKEHGFKKYDLGAFNPILNKTVYHFKAGIAGKNPWEEIYLGEYLGYFNVTGTVSYHLYNIFKYVRHYLKNITCMVVVKRIFDRTKII